jgi:hypothetical protein
MYLLKLITVRVRWPARPAELRAGLDFFGSFCIKAKRTEIDSSPLQRRRLIQVPLAMVL